MDQSGVSRLEGIGISTRKRRSQPSRRPRPEQSLPDQSPKSSTPVSDDMSRASSDENIGEGNSGGKLFSLNQCVLRSLPVGGNGKCEGTENVQKREKVKLKVGGVTRTIQTKSNSNGTSGSGSLLKTNQFSDNARSRQRLITQESSDEYHSPPSDKKRGLQGVPWKDFSKGKFIVGKEGTGRTSTRNGFGKQGNKSDSAGKNKRLSKRRALDDEFDDEDEDDEIRYLEKLRTSKIAGGLQSNRKLQKGGKYDIVEDVGKNGRDAKRSKSGDSDEEEEPSSDDDIEGKKTKKQKKDPMELPIENKREVTLTNRQRAILNKDAGSAPGTSLVEFPNGLPPAPPRKQKEKLTEVEQQLKKVEAAQRRRLQNEKAARESEAEAIRKILGQDSSRKKREEKIKKRQEELAQEKAAQAQMLASNTVRTVIGPTGTTVTFPREMGFPKIFDANHCSYPPPREKCAGPSCTNAYKYRDSKSNLPLCSLQCYKAINGKIQTEAC